MGEAKRFNMKSVSLSCHRSLMKRPRPEDKVYAVFSFKVCRNAQQAALISWRRDELVAKFSSKP